MDLHELDGDHAKIVAGGRKRLDGKSCLVCVVVALSYCVNRFVAKIVSIRSRSMMKGARARHFMCVNNLCIESIQPCLIHTYRLAMLYQHLVMWKQLKSEAFHVCQPSLY